MANTDRESGNSSIRFRIRIGVTGHRVLADGKKLSARIKEVLETKIADLIDDDRKCVLRSELHRLSAFSILTPLAEGADRLVAKEVLKFPGARIEVVLPLAKVDYLQDFETEESKQEFEDLLSKDRRPIALRKKTLREDFSEGDLQEVRRKAYGDVGRYVVDHCDVLIALWDSKPLLGKGGTADTIDYARKKRRPIITISTISPYEISIEKGNGLDARSVEKTMMFNSLKISEKAVTALATDFYESLFSNAQGERLSPEAKSIVQERLAPFYARASKIAKRNHRLYYHVGTMTYSLSAASVVAAVLGVLFHELSPCAFLAEFLMLLLIILSIAYANHSQAHKNWLETRFLAERIRSAAFLAVCGVEVSPIDVLPHMRAAHQPDDWMVRAFFEIWNSLPPMKGCTKQYYQPCIDFVRKHWLGTQIAYHRNKATIAGKVAQTLERLGISIFFLALAAALGHTIFGLDAGISLSSNLEKLLIFLAVALPAIGTAIGGIRGHREYSRIAERSKYMAAALSDLDEEFSQVTLPHRLETLLRETETLMLRETQDWLMLMRFEELKPPA